MSNNINIEPVQEESQDFLEVDDEIRGQKYCLLSFIEPEEIMQNKEAFKTAKYLQSINKDDSKSFKDFYEQYLDFQYKYHDEIDRDYIKENGLKTNIRGVKIRGVYDTIEEAKLKAALLQKKDSLFHVFMGEVGYWLPFNPLPDKIKDEVYINQGLQELMEGYKQNAINKDLLYEQEKRDKLKQAAEDLKKGREQEDKFIRETQQKLKEEEEEKQNNIEVNATEEPDVTATEKPEVTATEEPDVTATEEPDVTATEEPDVTTIEKPDVTATEEPEVTTIEKPDVTASEEPDVTNNKIALEAEIDNENINLQNSDDVINNLSNQDPWLKNKLEQGTNDES